MICAKNLNGFDSFRFVISHYGTTGGFETIMNENRDLVYVNIRFQNRLLGQSHSFPELMWAQKLNLSRSKVGNNSVTLGKTFGISFSIVNSDLEFRIRPCHTFSS